MLEGSAHWICPRVKNEMNVLLDVPGTITDSLKFDFKDLIIVLIIVYFVIKLVFLLLFKCTSIEHKELLPVRLMRQYDDV